jgi:hypothetical protein
VTGAFQLDATAGASGQALVSAGGSNTPIWSTLGTMAAQNASAVAITGGTITGITDLTVADGGTGASSITANSVILGNGTSALSGNLVAPSTSGNVLTSNGTTWVSQENLKLTLGTVQASTSGTSIDFTGIPSWVKRVTVMFNGTSVSGTSPLMVQLMTGSSVPTTSGYLGTANGGFNNDPDGSNHSAGFKLANTSPSASYTNNVNMIITNLTGNTWSELSIVTNSTSPRIAIGSGSVALASILTGIRITTVNGTDTFDAGSVNIIYE